MSLFKLTQPNLQDELKKLQYDTQIQEDTNQAYLVIKHEKREYPIFFRIMHEGELLQILAFIPTNYKDEVVSDLSRLLLMLNKELDVPGFCIDENSKTVFYRVMIPTYKKELATDVLEAFVGTIINVCKTFSPVVEAVAMGAMTLEEVINKAQELKAKA